MAAPINRNGGRKPRSPLTVALNQMRTKLWFDGLKLATGQTTAYGVGQKLLKADDKLFERYERGENSPTTTTVKVINHDFPGTATAFLHGPTLHKQKPDAIGLWPCLSNEPATLRDYLASVDEDWKKLLEDGCGFDAMLVFAARDFLLDYSDAMNGEEEPSYEHTFGTALMPPGGEAFIQKVVGENLEYIFLAPYSLGESEYLAKIWSGMAQQELEDVIEELASLLAVSNQEQSTFSRSLRNLDPVEFVRCISDLILQLVDLETALDGQVQSNPLAHALETWRLRRLKELGLDMNALAGLMAVWRYGEHIGEDMLNYADFFRAIDDYVASRLLYPFGIAADFKSYFQALTAQK